jgi:hypothetical protein
MKMSRFDPSIGCDDEFVGQEEAAARKCAFYEANGDKIALLAGQILLQDWFQNLVPTRLRTVTRSDGREVEVRSPRHEPAAEMAVNYAASIYEEVAKRSVF